MEWKFVLFDVAMVFSLLKLYIDYIYDFIMGSNRVYHTVLELLKLLLAKSTHHIFRWKITFTKYSTCTFFQELIRTFKILTKTAFVLARTQPIIANSTPDMIQDLFLPIATILQKNSQIVERKERQLLASKHGSSETADLEADVQQVKGGGGSFVIITCQEFLICTLMSKTLDVSQCLKPLTYLPFKTLDISYCSKPMTYRPWHIMLFRKFVNIRWCLNFTKRVTN